MIKYFYFSIFISYYSCFYNNYIIFDRYRDIDEYWCDEQFCICDVMCELNSLMYEFGKYKGKDSTFDILIGLFYEYFCYSENFDKQYVLYWVQKIKDKMPSDNEEDKKNSIQKLDEFINFVFN